MTRYRFDNQEKKKNTSRTKIAVIGFIVVGLALLIVFVITPFIKNIARGPEWLRNAAVESVEDTAGTLSSKSTLIAQINALKSEIETQKAKLLELQMAEDENIALRKELSYLENPSAVTLAQVIAKPSQSLYNSLVIDRGSDDEISVGALVTAHGSIGLGTVVSVTAHTATIQLFSGPQFDGNLVMKDNDITVPATGKGSGNFEIHIPHEIQVEQGDILAFPSSPNIAVGVVESVIYDPRDPFQTVLARTPVNVQELRFVEVVK